MGNRASADQDSSESQSINHRRRISGGEYRDNIRQDQSNYNLNPYSLLLDDKRQSFVGAVYLQDELTITKSLALNAGLRYDYYSATQASTDPRSALIYRPWNQTAFKFILPTPSAVTVPPEDPPGVRVSS